MALMRPLSTLREDINRMFSDIDRGFFSPLAVPSSRMLELGAETPSVWMPAVDVFEENNDIKVKAQVPGIPPENIDIEVEDSSLTLSGETAQRAEETKGNVYRQEICYGRFFRRIPLPTDVQADKAKADFQDGLLTVTLPKSEEVQRRKIKVSR